MTRKIKVFSLYSQDEIESLNRLLKTHSKAKLTYMTPANGYGSGGALVIADYEDDDLSTRYADALPDDLPVIPEELGEYIKWGKKYDIQLYVMYYYQLIHRPGFKKLNDDAISWMIANQDTFARAWLLGVWRVEGTGEIVKLEAEK